MNIESGLPDILHGVRRKPSQAYILMDLTEGTRMSYKTSRCAWAPSINAKRSLFEHAFIKPVQKRHDIEHQSHRSHG